ncbi:MAG: ABC transporter substrate-binding protein [Chthoniobacterales bacterium]|nr:ABC transporter substrate-binding protein [Chthoniobacterales bacterium]
MRLFVRLAVVLLAASSAAQAGDRRIITAGSAVTEIACALGLGPEIVAVDTSSRHLDETREKPDIGYIRTLGAEALLSQNPSLVLVSGEAGPPPVLEQIRGAGVELVVVENEHSLENIDDKIRAVAAATGREGAAEQIIARFDADLAKLHELVGASKTRPSAVFLLARQGGSVMVAGRDTAAHAMIEASGARNAGEAFTGYKPLSAEIFAASAPDGVIVSESVAGDDAELLASVPGLEATPAGRNLRVIRVDDASFLGFGPRSAATAAMIAAGLRQP